MGHSFKSENHSSSESGAKPSLRINWGHEGLSWSSVGTWKGKAMNRILSANYMLEPIVPAHKSRLFSLPNSAFREPSW